MMREWRSNTRTIYSIYSDNSVYDLVRLLFIAVLKKFELSKHFELMFYKGTSEEIFLGSLKKMDQKNSTQIRNFEDHFGRLKIRFKNICDALNYLRKPRILKYS